MKTPHQILRDRLMPLAALLLLLLTTALQAAAPATPTTPAKEPKRLFWKVTSPTTTVYFLGSIHFASADMYPLPPEIEAAYKDSAQLVIEADITKVNQEQLIVQIMAQGMYPQGDSLDKHLTPETKKALDEFLAAKGLPFAIFAQMKPILASLTLQTLAATDGAGLTEDGIDMHFITAANTAKDKKIVELETADYQLKLLLGVDDAVADRALRESLKDGSKEELDKIIKSWKEGDEKSMVETVTAGEKEDPAQAKFNDILLYGRNEGMAKKIDEILKGKEKAFVVVGAAHFVGDKGILKLLEAEGYKVERPTLTTPPKTPANPR